MHLMATFRRIIVLIALALASVGNLPLVVHHLTCHHSHLPATSSSELAPACSCSHQCHAAPNGHSNSDDQPILVVQETHTDDCAVCFQLSQLPQPTTETTLSRSCPLVSHLVVPTASLQLPAVKCPHSPRGPPAV